MILSMQNVFKEYINGKMTVPVLRDICLEVEQGDYVAIMGRSGSGKTTLMNIIGCLDLPTSGKYIFNNYDITTRTNDQLATIRNEDIGFVFQNFYLLPNYSALDNVALPLVYANVPKKERIARAQEALRIVGLEDRMNFHPNQLSGGQCQRVAIARAIVSRPQLLLADEPTGALDTASGDQIMDIFERLNQEGVTILMITHELAVAQRAHTIYHLLDGRLDDPLNLHQRDWTLEEIGDGVLTESASFSFAAEEPLSGEGERASDEEEPLPDQSEREENAEIPDFLELGEDFDFEPLDELAEPEAFAGELNDAPFEEAPAQWPDDEERTVQEHE